MAYKCPYCNLLGSGVPPRRHCPNCKKELVVKVRSTSEDIYEGDFLTVSEAASEVIQIVKTFSHTKCQLYVAPEVDEFLKIYFPNELNNYIIDVKLRNFQMNVR